MIFSFGASTDILSKKRFGDVTLGDFLPTKPPVILTMLLKLTTGVLKTLRVGSAEDMHAKLTIANLLP